MSSTIQINTTVFKERHIELLIEHIIYSQLLEGVSVFKVHEDVPSVVVISGAPILYSDFCTMIMIMNSNAGMSSLSNSDIETRITDFWEMVKFKPGDAREEYDNSDWYALHIQNYVASKSENKTGMLDYYELMNEVHKLMTDN